MKEEIKMGKSKKAEKTAYMVVDLILSFFVIMLPLLAIILYAFGVSIPKAIIGIYSSTVFIVAGILFIVFTVLEKFGFGKEGAYFSRLFGWERSGKKKAKANTVIFGSVMIAIGVLFAILTYMYR